ncbi:class I mannose-6-phosphate isomerase [Parapedobacter tibetensis]|uniref:class I mannose-6-phosphate isomerase n=1 Tax=Parapedobacter tibetensis TaxID=2972951 RepID=UPI00214DD4E3|nr:class I mannose-6-phosphate isomerase [Parapedobacter tibetensis]
MELKGIGEVPETMTSEQTSTLRKTKQEIMPAKMRATNHGGYDIYPVHPLGEGKIHDGYNTLAQWVVEQKTVVIDGYVGNFWDRIAADLNAELEKLGAKTNWYVMDDFLKPESEIEQLVKPFLGNEDSVWGTKTTLELTDFYRRNSLAALEPDPDYAVNILIGTGAALSGWDASVIYIDLPKNELQHRMNASAITNLGKSSSEKPAAMYKRFYFVDWVVCNKHKESVLHRVDVWADGQGIDWITWAYAPAILNGLKTLSQSVFRPRPWFTPGSWGGQWIKEHIPQINQEEPNYAWSFELIAPENGLVFESSGTLLEISFDCLMAVAGVEVLGKHHGRFGSEFPIRFDFLDTFEGGNLSIQCHPSLPYIRENFGEEITQDETYYILDCAPDAKVYLGFQDDIDPVAFRQELENSLENNTEVAIANYVQTFPAAKHDLFLIPNGTVHSSGKNNLVLEISATPYIFTFKMYDWLGKDLNGDPRPINIEHAFNNLRFDRKGQRVAEEHIAKPYALEQGDGWKTIHLPTHEAHFYDVHRIEFENEVTIHTQQVCHVLMLVEGAEIRVQIGDRKTVFRYAETFVIPAAVSAYTLVNIGGGTAKVMKAFVKDNYGYAS